MTPLTSVLSTFYNNLDRAETSPAIKKAYQDAEEDIARLFDRKEVRYERHYWSRRFFWISFAASVIGGSLFWIIIWALAINNLL